MIRNYAMILNLQIKKINLIWVKLKLAKMNMVMSRTRQESTRNIRSPANHMLINLKNSNKQQVMHKNG